MQIYSLYAGFRMQNTETSCTILLITNINHRVSDSYKPNSRIAYL